MAELNNNLNLQPEWITDDATGKITGYRFRGADTVFPFSNSFVLNVSVQFGWNSDLLINTKNFNTLTLNHVVLRKEQNGNQGLWLKGQTESGSWEYLYGEAVNNAGMYTYDESFDITKYSSLIIGVTGGYVLANSEFLFEYK